MRIAVVEDDAAALDSLHRTITEEGHECFGFISGLDLWRTLRHHSFDLLVIDWTLPDLTGAELIRMVRTGLGSNVPIIFMTPGEDDEQLVEGLGAGADDHLAQPVRAGELKARMQALLRRTYPQLTESELTFGVYTLLPRRRELLRRGETVPLTNREFELALMLFRNLGRLMARDHLCGTLVGPGAEKNSRSLDTHISRLRHKLDLRPHNGYLLSAIYRMGYRLDAIEERDLPTLAEASATPTPRGRPKAPAKASAKAPARTAAPTSAAASAAAPAPKARTRARAESRAAGR